MVLWTEKINRYLCHKTMVCSIKLKFETKWSTDHWGFTLGPIEFNGPEDRYNLVVHLLKIELQTIDFWHLENWNLVVLRTIEINGPVNLMSVGPMKWDALKVRTTDCWYKLLRLPFVLCGLNTCNVRIHFEGKWRSCLLCHNQHVVAIKTIYVCENCVETSEIMRCAWNRNKGIFVRSGPNTCTLVFSRSVVK